MLRFVIDLVVCLTQDSLLSDSYWFSEDKLSREKISAIIVIVVDVVVVIASVPADDNDDLHSSLIEAPYQAELMMLYVQANGIQPHHNNNNNLGILEDISFNTSQQGFVLDRQKEKTERVGKREKAMEL